MAAWIVMQRGVMEIGQHIPVFTTPRTSLRFQCEQAHIHPPFPESAGSDNAESPGKHRI